STNSLFMNPRRILPIIAALTFPALVWAQQPSARSEDLKSLRGTYVAAVERAAKPLRETYIKELQRLLDAKSKSGKLDEAIEIKSELERANVAARAANAPEASGGIGAPLQQPPANGEELKNLRGSYAAA